MRRYCQWLTVLVALSGMTAPGMASQAAEAHPTVDLKKGWKSLFNGKDLTGWELTRPGSWSAEAGVLARKGGADLWTVDEFGDFILDLEFKVAEGTNSGVCLRVKRDPEIQPWWRDGALEVQLVDSCAAVKPSMHDCGSLYDLVAPAKNAMRESGQWNRLTITAAGSRIAIVMNGEKIVDADLDTWTEAHKNPDGTPNKYAKPMKDAPRKGHLFLQEHGNSVWFRNLYIKPLDPAPQAAAAKQ